MISVNQLILAGFGGQGILSMGHFIAHAGLIENKNVSWLPSYGPEKRGGTANCSVIVGEEEVGSPIVTKATAIIVMNRPSFEKFESYVEAGGIVIYDSSLVSEDVKTRDDINYYGIPATRMADEYGNATFAGIILLGKLIKETGIIGFDSFEKSLYDVLKPSKHFLIPDEMKALKAGYIY